MTTAASARKAMTVCVEEEELRAAYARDGGGLQLEVVRVEPLEVAVEEEREPEVLDQPDVDGARDARRLRRGVIWLALMVALVVVVITSVPGLRSVESTIGAAPPGWIVAALALELLSCLSFVFTFNLVFSRAPLWFASRVAWSEMAFGAVLPAGGAGGLAVGAWILHAKGFPLGRVARRSAVLFLLTSAVNAIVLTLSGLALAIGVLPGPHNSLLGWLPAAVGAGTIAFFVALPPISNRLSGGESRARRWLAATADVVRDTERVLLSRDWRLVTALGYLLFDIAVLWACFKAFGSSPPFIAILLGYQIGYLANILPIPGGLGVLDGGLIGALLLYGTPATATAAAVLIYHAIALWLPTLIGAVEFWLVRRSFDQPVVLKPAAEAR
jgi:uncharacterized membrane protein YbhN (UPF0104 family)